MGFRRLLVEPDMTGRPTFRHPLLNHLVSGRQQRFRDGEAEGFGSTDVDHEVELGRLLHLEVGRFSALDNRAA
jgi:hypothetical protein